MRPLPVPIKQLPPFAQKQMRLFIKNCLSIGFIKSDIGIEATEELCESMLDIGRLKITIEPLSDEGGVGMMMFDDKINGYKFLNGLKISNMPPTGNPFIDEQPGINVLPF